MRSQSRPVGVAAASAFEPSTMRTPGAPADCAGCNGRRVTKRLSAAASGSRRYSPRAASAAVNGLASAARTRARPPQALPRWLSAMLRSLPTPSAARMSCRCALPALTGVVGPNTRTARGPRIRAANGFASRPATWLISSRYPAAVLYVFFVAAKAIVPVSGSSPNRPYPSCGTERATCREMCAANSATVAASPAASIASLLAIAPDCTAQVSRTRAGKDGLPGAQWADSHCQVPNVWDTAGAMSRAGSGTGCRSRRVRPETG
jgi:hypothetical protein